MARKVWIHRLSFNISREIRWMLAVSLALSLLLGVGTQRPLAATAVQSGTQSLMATARARGDSLWIVQSAKLKRAAERLEEGERLHKEGTAESLRKAITKYEEALSLLRDLGNRKAEAAVLDNIGVVYDLLDEKQKALDYYTQALSLWRDLGDRDGEAHTLNNLGAAYFDLGEKQKAIDYALQALPLWRDLGDHRGEAATLAGIGVVYEALGEKQKALDSHAQALLLWREVGDREGEGSTLTYIGVVYSSLGEKQRALDYYLQALPLRRAAGNRRGEAETLSNIGNVYLSLGEKQRALDYYNQALPLSRATGNRRVEAITLSNIGFLYSLLNEKQKALSYLNQALQLKRAVGDQRGEAFTLLNIGAVYHNLGETQKALDSGNQALRLFRAVGDPRGEAETLGGLAQVERNRNNLSEARAQIEKALNLVESLRTKVVSQELRASFFASVQDGYEFYIDLLMRLHKQHSSEKHDAMALQASERARARSLLESLTEARADIRQGVDPNLLARERELQQRLNAKAEYQFKLNSGPHSEEQAAAVAKEIDALTTELQQVQTQIRQTSPRYAALTQPQPLTAAEIQQQVLDADMLLLEYSLGEERSFLWAVTPTAITSYELPKRAEIEAAAQRVYELLADSSGVRGQTTKPRELRLKETSGQYLAAAASLSQMLLGPVAGQLGKKRLVIVADGMLHYIPFGALPDPNRLKESDGSWQPLVVEHEVVNLPSASTLAVLRRELAGRKPAAKTLAVLADPVFAKDDERIKPGVRHTAQQTTQPTPNPLNESITRKLIQIAGGAPGELRIARLPFTRQEAEQILALVPAGAGMTALDFEASRATAMSDQLSQYRYVHFATHGLADSERPELSTIVLSLFDEQGRPQEGFLRAHEVYNLNLPAELVVLSACETGLGKLTKGEGLVSLTRGFMYAGAARVVVSLWSVNDRATAELMTKFYRRVLVEGERPAAALRAAQIEMWRDKRWEAPYYWAAFTLQGEWR